MMAIALKKSSADDNFQSRVFSFLIDLFSGLKGFSHAELVFSDGECFTSFYGTGSLMLKRAHPAKDWVIVNLVTSDSDEEKVRDFAKENLGHPYDVRGVLHFVLPFEQEEREKYFCSELVVLALQQIGMFKGVISWKVSPNKLYELLKKGQG